MLYRSIAVSDGFMAACHFWAAQAFFLANDEPKVWCLPALISGQHFSISLFLFFYLLPHLPPPFLFLFLHMFITSLSLFRPFYSLSRSPICPGQRIYSLCTLFCLFCFVFSIS